MIDIRKNHLFIVHVLLVVTVAHTNCHKDGKFSLLMPNVRPNIAEMYLCTPVKVDRSNNYYIVGFQPNATAASAHHMLLYGCSKPGSSEPVWNCGEMAHKAYTEMETKTPCASGTEIIYAWARDAPALMLPPDVGFKVGGDSPIQYLVLQVHYAHIEHFRDGNTDDSGIVLQYTLRPLNKLAGVLLLGTAGKIPPRTVEYMETSCKLQENKTINPFAYRVHTHQLGKVVSGYSINPENKWSELGKRDPLTPQMFYPIHDKRPLTMGDRVAARCTMKSDRDTVTYIGATNEDEMCNFYLMYWIENDTPLQTKYCFTSGPPLYYWQFSNLVNIPDREASTL